MAQELTAYFELMSSQAVAPFKAHETDAGWDLSVSRPALIRPETVTEVHTDVKIALPEGWYAHIVGRSSTMHRYGLAIIDAVVDQGYRGELFLQAFNPTDREVTIPIGTRLAQIVILPVPAVTWVQVNVLPPSIRGRRGFGSSGF